MNANRAEKRQSITGENAEHVKRRKSIDTSTNLKHLTITDNLLKTDESLFAIVNFDHLEESYWNKNSVVNNASKRSIVKSIRKEKSVSKNRRKLHFRKTQKWARLALKKIHDETFSEDSATASDAYDIESVRSDEINITHKKHQNVIRKLNTTPNNKQKCKITNKTNHLKINESGIGVLSTSANSKSSHTQTEHYQLSFDVNSYFQNDKLSQISKAIDFVMEKSDSSSYEVPPNVTLLNHEIDDLSEEFLCSEHEWNEDENEIVDCNFDNDDMFSEGCHDDLSQFYDSTQVMRQIESVITSCDVVNDSFKDLNQNGSHIEDKLVGNDCLVNRHTTNKDNLSKQIKPKKESKYKIKRNENIEAIPTDYSKLNSKSSNETYTATHNADLANGCTENILNQIENGTKTGNIKKKNVTKFEQKPLQNENIEYNTEKISSKDENSTKKLYQNSNVRTKNKIHNVASTIEMKLSNNKETYLTITNTITSDNSAETNVLLCPNNRPKTDALINRSNNMIAPSICLDKSKPHLNTIKSIPSSVTVQNSIPKRQLTKNHSAEIKQAILKVKENEHWDETIASGISQLFKSSQYKREVATVFDNLETTICQISEGQDESLQKYPKNTTLNWTEETLANKFLDIESQGLSSVIKRTLISNVHNPPSHSNLPNESPVRQDVFVNIGPFYGLPLKVKELIQQYKGINSLYDWQEECLKLEAIQNRKNLVYALPTSGGKTLVSEILVLREIMCRKHNVLFILPYVSIVQEKVWALSPFALALNFLVEEFAAGKGAYPPRKRRYKRSVYIATIEKALGLINSLMETDRLKEIGLVVVDELHLMGESGRGTTLEMLLTKLMHAAENIHIVGMSATIGNLPEVCAFLKAEVYTKDFRPVELKEYVKCEKDIAEVNRKATSLEESLVPVRCVEFAYSDESTKIDPDRLAGLVMEVIPAGSCLVFCASKKNCENVALLLCRIFHSNLLEHKKNEKEGLIHLMRTEGNLCPTLKRTIPYGVAYHHSGLTTDERRLIEDAFRIGTLCVICCTSTLAAGVNLPAKRVILRSPYIGREFINLARYKQMSGRAGRAGMGEIGESILVCTRKDLRKVAELLCSPMDQVESKMFNNDLKGLRDLILSCIALGTASTRRTLRQITNCTLMAVQQERLGQNVKKATDNAISELFKLGALQLATDKSVIPDTNVSVLLHSTLVNESPIKSPTNKKQILIGNDSKLVISKLGKAAIKGGLDLDTAHILYEDLVQAQASLVLLSCLHLLYLVTPYELARQIVPSLPNYYSIYVELGIKELQTARVLGLNEACEAGLLAGRRIKTVNERVLNRFYLTLILHDLWNGKPVFEVSEKYQVSRGIVQQLMVSAATFASNVVRFCEQLDEFWAFVDLLRGMSQRLQHCSSKELISLMELPSVKQGRARQLYRAGYKTLQSVARANPNDLINNIEHMSHRVANQLIASAKLLLLERVENLREEAQDVLDGIDDSQVF